MRRSSSVVAPILASTALGLLTGCHGPEMQRCVDSNNRVVDPGLCQSSSSGSGSHGGGGFYHYYYGGSGSYARGSTAVGGTTEPTAGHSYSVTNGTARGGFGSSFSGGGEGEGGSAHGGSAGE